MQSVKLSATEIKMLKAMQKYPHADIGYQEFNGYLRFPPAESILKALNSLMEEQLIVEQEKPLYGYKLTKNGEQYLSSIRFSVKAIMPSKEKVVWAIISAAIGAIVTGLLKP